MFFLPLGLGLLIIFLTFIAEYVDSSLGMGFGTTLTPLLLLMGFEPLQVVPAVLLSELASGLAAGLFHHQFGNVDFGLPRVRLTSVPAAIERYGFVTCLRKALSRHLKISLLLAGCSVLGTTAAVLLALRLPDFYLKLYIGVLIFAVGVIIVTTANRRFGFSWKKIGLLGTVAAFNKGISGGGYGPLVTGGQLLSGVNSKNAVGITSLAEGLTCMVGVILYLLFKGNIRWNLAPYLLIGAAASVPLSAYTVRSSNTERLKLIIGVVTIGMGLLTLLKALKL